MRRHITYANVVFTLALFVVLGGGAYAVTGRPTADGVIHGCVAANGTLRIVGNSHACHRARGHGKSRIPGESPISWNRQGPTGPPGKDALANLVVRTGFPPGDGFTATNGYAYCQPGERAVGGGTRNNNNQPLVASFPTVDNFSAPDGATPTGWEVFTSTATNPIAMVICASP